MQEAAFVLSIVLGAVSLPAVHELGHYVAGLLVGRETRVDWRSLTASTTLGGSARAPYVVFLLSGPATNLGVGGLLVFVGDAHASWLGLVHLGFGALNLLPFPARTDGSKLLHLLRSGIAPDETRSI